MNDVLVLDARPPRGSEHTACVAQTQNEQSVGEGNRIPHNEASCPTYLKKRRKKSETNDAHKGKKTKNSKKIHGNINWYTELLDQYDPSLDVPDIPELDPQLLVDLPLEQDSNNVPDYLLHTKRDNAGVTFGKKYGCCVAKPSNRDGNVLTIGGTGSGKSSCIALPTLETWNGTIFAIDIKGELLSHWKNTGAKRSYKVFNLSDEDEPSYGYDPYQFLRQGGEENLIHNVREIALSILPTPLDTRDSFWIKAAQNILTGAILYYYSLNKHTDSSSDTSNKVTFIDTMIKIMTTESIEALLKEIGANENSVAYALVNSYANLKPEVLAGILSELCNHIIVYATDSSVMDALAPGSSDNQKIQNAFEWSDLLTENIFIRLSEDKLEQWENVITMMLNQLIRTLERLPDKNSPKRGDTPPILLLLDEFPRLGKVDSIINALATLRSKGVTIALFIQSLSQLDLIYGRDARRVILDNCEYKAILRAGDVDTQNYFSELAGTIKVGKKGLSKTYDENGNVSGFSQHINEALEPLIQPHEFAILQDIVLIAAGVPCRVEKTPYYIEKTDF